MIIDKITGKILLVDKATSSKDGIMSSEDIASLRNAEQVIEDGISDINIGEVEYNNGTITTVKQALDRLLFVPLSVTMLNNLDTTTFESGNTDGTGSFVVSWSTSGTPDVTAKRLYLGDVLQDIGSANQWTFPSQTNSVTIRLEIDTTNQDDTAITITKTLAIIFKKKIWHGNRATLPATFTEFQQLGNVKWYASGNITTGQVGTGYCIAIPSDKNITRCITSNNESLPLYGQAGSIFTKTTINYINGDYDVYLIAPTVAGDTLGFTVTLTIS